MSKEIDVSEVILYTTITFTIDNEIQLIIKNLDTNELSIFEDREWVIEQIYTSKWYMYGCYDTINVFGNDFIILSKTKKKIEMMVKRG